MTSRLIASLICSTLTAYAAARDAPSSGGKADLRLAPRSVVIYNSSVPASKELAEYYAQKREIPATHVVGINCPNQEEITRADFRAKIEGPLRAIFTEKGWWKLEDSKNGKMCTQTSVRVLTMVMGVPLKIAEEPVYEVDSKSGKKAVKSPAAGRQNCSSLDSELMAFGLLEHPAEGPLNNPYYEKSAPFASLPLAPIFLVGRLDGPKPEMVKRMIDDAVAVEKTGLYGRAYVDLAQKNEAGYKEGEDWLLAAGRTLGQSGFPLVVDIRSERFPQNYPMTDCAMYLGWYTLPPDGPFLNPNFKFKKGAVACHIHSFSALSVQNPSQGWVSTFVKQGVCATFGNTYEPYLSLTVHLDKLTDRLLRGYTIVEAAAMATPALSWMNVVVGDPLYRPFAAPVEMADTDREFRTFRVAMRDASEAKMEKSDLTAKLESAADSQKSGILWEALAQLTQGLQPDNADAVFNYQDKALAAYPSAPDKIRITLEKGEVMQQRKQSSAARKLLEGALKTWPNLPETAALNVMLVEWGGQPPKK